VRVYGGGAGEGLRYRLYAGRRGLTGSTCTVHRPTAAFPLSLPSCCFKIALLRPLY